MIKVGIGKCIGSPTASQEEGVEFQGRGFIIAYLLLGNRGLTVIYECNNGCLGERKGIIMGCYLVGLEAFL